MKVASVNPLLSPVLIAFCLYYPAKLFLCLEFALLDLNWASNSPAATSALHSLALLHGNLLNLLPAAFCSPELADAWPGEVGQGGEGTEGEVASGRVSLGRNGKDLCCQMLGFSFCARKLDLLENKIVCVVSLSTGEHGYWHSGF